MGGIRPVDISNELRRKLAAHPFREVSFVGIPTGRDPRWFTEEDNLPALVVNIGSILTRPVAIGGASEAFHGISVFAVLPYEPGEDINLLKLSISEDLFEFCTRHKVVPGLYKMFIGTDSGRDFPEFDTEPDEENPYIVSGARVCLLKMTVAVRQIPFFNINEP